MSVSYFTNLSHAETKSQLGDSPPYKLSIIILLLNLGILQSMWLPAFLLVYIYIYKPGTVTDDLQKLRLFLFSVANLPVIAVYPDRWAIRSAIVVFKPSFRRLLLFIEYVSL